MTKYDMKYVNTAATELLEQRLNWPRVRDLSGDDFVNQTVGLVQSWTGCPDREVAGRICLKIWRRLRGE